MKFFKEIFKKSDKVDETGDQKSYSSKVKKKKKKKKKKGETLRLIKLSVTTRSYYQTKIICL